MSRLIAFWILFIFILGCDGGVRSGEVGTLYCSSESFLFPALRVGEEATRRIELYNEGDAVLKLAHFEAEFSKGHRLSAISSVGTDASVQRETIYYDEDGPSFPQVVEIAPQESLSLILNYISQSNSEQTGELRFETNDPEHRSVRLPIESSGQTIELAVFPSELDFERVDAGVEKKLDLKLENVGQKKLLIEKISIYGSQDFTLLRDGHDVIAEQLFADLDGDGQEGLAPGQSVTLQVRYFSEVFGPDEAELSIRSNDDRAPEVSVKLTANAGQPCIQVYPEGSIDFATCTLYTECMRGMSIVSCGTNALKVSGVYFREDSSTQFYLSPVQPFSLPAVSEGNQEPSKELSIEFIPSQKGIQQGTLVIESNDPQFPVLEIPVVGEAVDNECPVARVRESVIDAPPMEFIELSGRDSVDPDGEIVRWSWTLTAKPEGSMTMLAEDYSNYSRPFESALPDDPTTPGVNLVPDLPGTYVVELQVEDDSGLVSPSGVCPSNRAQVQINVVPNSELWVQMVWQTPEDTDETDNEGSDLDLHMRHPQTAWSVTPLSNLQSYSCSPFNPRPNWSNSGNTNDPRNPLFEISDSNGAGPESIRLREPEVTGAVGYQVGVYYYNDCIDWDCRQKWGNSIATVRVFLSGQLAAEWDQTLQSKGTWWIAGQIDWTEEGGTATRIDRVTTNPNQ